MDNYSSKQGDEIEADTGEIDPDLAKWFPVEDEELEDAADEPSEDTDSDESEPVSLDSIISDVNLPSKVRLIDDAQATDAKAYSSGTYEAIEVGSKFADELERLGFEIIPTGHSEARAVKGDVALKMAITTENSELVEGDEKIYPDVDDDAVVVQIWLED